MARLHVRIRGWIREGGKRFLQQGGEISWSLAENLDMGPELIQIFHHQRVDFATRLHNSFSACEDLPSNSQVYTHHEVNARENEAS